MLYLQRILFLNFVFSVSIWSSNAQPRNTFSFSSEDFDNPDWKGHEIFESGPIVKVNNNKPDLPVLLRDYWEDADKPKTKPKPKPKSCHANRIHSKCTLLANCDVVCKIALAGEKSQMKIVFPCQKGSPLVTKVILPLSKKQAHKYSLKVNSDSDTLIKELGFSLGNNEVNIKLSVTMNKVSDEEISFKVYSTTITKLQGYGNSKMKTKLLDVRRPPLTNKCVGIKGKPVAKPSYNSGPCAKLRLPSVCSITADCMYITCGLKFMGQETVLLFKINKCARPMTLMVGVKISALHINWNRKLKSGVTIPIPGYAVSAGGIEGGVLIDVFLRPKRGKLQLGIKLLVGVKVGFIKTFPVNFTVLKLGLPIKITGCAKNALNDKKQREKDAFRPTSATVAHTIQPTATTNNPTEDSFTPDDWE